MLKHLASKFTRITDNLDKNIEQEENNFSNIQLTIRFFYFFIFYLSLQSFSQHSILPFWKDLLESERYFIPLWCTQWMVHFQWEFIIHFTLIFFFLVSFVAMLFGLQYRILRIILFIGFFNYTALVNSFGKIDHHLHISLVIGFLLIFVSHEPGKLAKLFKSIQLFILSTYTFSGIFKFWGILSQSMNGEITVFYPNSLAYHLSKHLYVTGKPVYFQEIILNSTSYLFSIFLFLGYIIEIVAVLAILQNKLLPLMGIMLVLLHTVILLTVGPEFIFQIVILALFFILPYSIPYKMWNNRL